MPTPRERAIVAMGPHLSAAYAGQRERGDTLRSFCGRYAAGLLHALEAAGLRIVDAAEDDARAVQRSRVRRALAREERSLPPPEHRTEYGRGRADAVAALGRAFYGDDYGPKGEG